jgi:hypothetical protein
LTGFDGSSQLKLSIGNGDINLPSNLLFFPYGTSDFGVLRQEPRNFYVDKTYIIRDLEAVMIRHAVIHRPPRWGKSLFMSVLRYYYDVSQAEHFEELFGGLDIGIKPTPLKNSYYVLSLDLTLDVDCSMAQAEIRQRLERKMFSFTKSFAAYYNFSIPLKRDGSLGLLSIAHQVSKVGGKLLVLVDEYDRLANELMFENPAAYNTIVRGRRFDALSMPIRAVFQAIQEVSGMYDCRSIMTGIVPVPLYGAFGGSTWMDITFDETIGNLFGFSDNDLRRALEVKGLAGSDIERVLNVMREHYNGYKFFGSSCSYYNPTLALYFLHTYFKDESLIFRKVVDNQPTEDQDDISTLMEDKNVSASTNVFALLSNSSVLDSVCFRLLNKDNPMVVRFILEHLPLAEWNDSEVPLSIQADRIAFLMYYHGIATFTSATDFPFQLQVPNKLVRGRFLDRLRNTIDLRGSDFTSCFTDPTAVSLQALLQNILDKQETVKDNFFSGGALQTELECVLNAVQREERGLTVLAGRSAANGLFELCIGMDGRIMILLELKRVCPNAIDYSGLGIDITSNLPMNTARMNWYPEEFKAAQKCLKGLSEEELRCLAINPDWNENAKSVEELELQASVQCLKNLDDLKARVPERAIYGFTVIQVGWRLVVKRVPWPARSDSS